jgi:hypothetical protein
MKRTKPAQRKPQAAPLRKSAAGLSTIPAWVWRLMAVAAVPAAILLLGVLVPLLPLLIPMTSLGLVLLIITDAGPDLAGRRAAASLWAVFILPWLIAAFLAPFRALTLFFSRFICDASFNAFSGPCAPFTLSLADGFVGAAGTVLAFTAGLVTVSVLVMQKHQVANLSTSTTRGAAVGLAEFKGIVRKTQDRPTLRHEEGDGAILPEEHILYYQIAAPTGSVRLRQRWQRFYLEDDTGRILVDPRGARFWDGKGSPFFEPVRKILLTKRISRPLPNPYQLEMRSLKEGDRIYAIGAVQRDPDAPLAAADEDALVVCPSTESHRLGRLVRLLFPDYVGKRHGRGWEYRHVFLLADTEEADLLAILKQAVWQSLILSLGWMGASAWLLLETLRELRRLL